MKVLMVNGSPHEEGCTYTALEEVAKALEKAGVETEIMWLGVDAIAGCIGCGACAKTGNKPGVTKGKQWIRLNKQVELLDTPGILWPKFEDQAVGLRLAFIGSMKDEILNTEELAAELIKFLGTYYPDVLPEKYAVEPDEDPYVVLHQIAKNRNCVVKGNELNTEKAAMLLLDDFRNGRLGRLTLEYPEGVC